MQKHVENLFDKFDASDRVQLALSLVRTFVKLGSMHRLADLQQSLDGGEPADREGQASLPIDVHRVRTFDTPDFAGMRFLEVETKSALNRVHGMPFKWSINPYRGCSHACSYCLVGETPILMGDGRTKPLADVRVGDEVYGTVEVGCYRRCVITRVLDHWSTVKPAYRIILRDGTTLVASGDHRFLSDQGWKHVTGAEQGCVRRPFLTTNRKLIGTGAFATPPKDTPGYRRGYLCGMLRADAHLGTHRYERPGRAHGDVPRVRLAVADREALDRSQAYMGAEGIETDIWQLIDWPSEPDEGWCAGFLAGIFDAEGGYNRGVLRISTTDPRILAWIESCLGRLGLPVVTEPPQPNGCLSVRVPGGLRQHLRFFHATDPAITRKRAIEHTALTSDAPLQVEAIEPLGVEIPMYDITTGTGDFIANGVVSHNCFARPSHAYLNLSPGEDFDKTVVVKTNVAEVLRRELAKPSWAGEHVAMGTNTDPYQRAEGRYRLMPGIIEALGESRTPFSILTKGTLITRDRDRLAAAAEHAPVSAAFTVGMLDHDLWRSAEPGTPSPRARLRAVRALNDAGVPTGVMIAPIMPGLNDDHEQLDALVAACVDAGATHITPIALHLRTSRPNSPTGASVRDVFWPWLVATHPELVDRYRELYRRGANADADWRDPVQRFVAERREAYWRERGRPARPAGWRGRSDDDSSDEGEAPQQLKLL